MTYEELKVEAERQGFNLVKKYERLIKLEPCICGSKRISRWRGRHSYQYYCPKCDRKALGVETYINYDDPNDKMLAMSEVNNLARKNWNEMIRKERKAQNADTN